MQTPDTEEVRGSSPRSHKRQSDHPTPRPGQPASQPCENFLYVFKAARRAARAAAMARSPSLPLALPLRRRQRRSAGAKSGNASGRAQPRSSRAAAGFDKGTLAMAQIGLTGAGQKPARPPDSVRAIAPYQIPPLCPVEALPSLTVTVGRERESGSSQLSGARAHGQGG